MSHQRVGNLGQQVRLGDLERVEKDILKEGLRVGGPGGDDLI